MAKRITVSACLDEIRRLRAENLRLTRLSERRIPQMSELRELETVIRELVDNVPDRLLYVLAKARALTGNEDDLPTLAELRGIWSERRDAIYAAIGEPVSVDAVREDVR